MSLKSIFFLQVQELIVLGRKRVVQATDRLAIVPEVNPRSIPWDESAVDWTNRRSFLRSLMKVSKPTWSRAVKFQVIASCFSFATPFLLHAFISRLQKGNFTQQDLLELSLIAISFGLCGAGNGVVIQHYFFQTLKFNQISTNLVNKKLFSHSLKLSASAKNKYQVGDIVNYMSTDSDAIADASITTIDLANAVVLLVGCTITLFVYLGWSATSALVVMALLIPITNHLSKSFIHLEDRMLVYRDQRMTLMTQVLNAIRVVKYFVWEKSVLAEVNEVRKKEIQSRYELAQAEIFWGLVYTSISSIVLFSALLTHVLRGFEVDLALIFTCISIFSIMEDHFGGLSKFISRFINILVSSDRITTFLRSDVVDLSEKPKSGDFLKIEHLAFHYNDQHKIIGDLSLVLQKGQSLAIVGPVGGGKSTLLHLLMSELEPARGQIAFSEEMRSKAFVPQDAYIVNSSLRENIIFGKTDVEESNVMDALRVSALEYDLMAWPSGLETEIGEKGVNLSGGQKQRVSLARAYLADADFILLDDPLSAVDPNTEKWLCDALLFGAWKNKTRVVVTHRLGSLTRFDQILFIENGETFIGTYSELLIKSKSFQKFLKTHDENVLKELSSAHQMSTSQSTSVATGDSSRITEDEDRAIGAVDKSVYLDYVRALGGFGKNQRLIQVLLFLGALAVVAAPLTQKLWLSQSQHLQSLSALKIIIVYGILGLLTMVITFVSNSFWSRRGIEAGRLFHDRMLNAVLSTPIRFFDSTPVGRILQRFSRDMESVDIQLQWTFDHTIHAFFHITVSFLLIVFVLPFVIVFMVPIFWFYYRIQNDYRRVAREIKRLDSTARSPRYAHFKETLNGLFVIRAFDKSEWAMQQFYSKLTFSAEMSRTHFLVNRWFSVKLPLIGAAISTVTGLTIVASSHYGFIAAGTAGLATLYAIDFWRHLNWGVRVFSDLESRLTSVERLQFYAELPPEQDVVGAVIHTTEFWPEGGELEFKNVSLRYAPHLPQVLKNVSFKIPSGSRVGLVGRTGSGKSTVFQSVYRFADIESGEIRLDNISIHSVPLEKLRRNLAVIPQDPALFMGSLRGNIDRYAQASDNEIWAVLKKVSLDNFIYKLPGQLLFQVAENGANLSQGQRQLLCLARALLMKVKIVFLDEATASVDVETDAIVQKVIKESLDGITLVTIAHRLSTLDGYDMIIELKNGEVV